MGRLANLHNHAESDTSDDENGQTGGASLKGELDVKIEEPVASETEDDSDDQDSDDSDGGVPLFSDDSAEGEDIVAKKPSYPRAYGGGATLPVLAPSARVSESSKESEIGQSKTPTRAQQNRGKT